MGGGAHWYTSGSWTLNSVSIWDSQMYIVHRWEREGECATLVQEVGMAYGKLNSTLKWAFNFQF